MGPPRAMQPDLASISGWSNRKHCAGLWLVSLESWSILLVKEEKGEKSIEGPEATRVLGHLTPASPFGSTIEYHKGQ